MTFFFSASWSHKWSTFGLSSSFKLFGRLFWYMILLMIVQLVIVELFEKLFFFLLLLFLLFS